MTKKLAVAAILLLVLGAACQKKTPPKSTNVAHSVNDRPVVVGMPMAVEDIAGMAKSFSRNEASPWQGANTGFDLMTSTDLVAVRAAVAGVVHVDGLTQDSATHDWQVTVRVTANGYDMVYVFDPGSTEQTVGQRQVQQIAVKNGQSVKAGDVLGRLIHSADGAFVRFGVHKGKAWLCPTNFLTATAKPAMYAALQHSHEGWNLCY